MGYATLFMLVKHAKERQRPVRFCNMHPDVRVGSDIVGLPLVVEIHDSEDSGAQGFLASLNLNPRVLPRGPAIRGPVGDLLGRPAGPRLELEDPDMVIPRLHVEARGRDDEVLPPAEGVARFHRFEPGGRLRTLDE